MNIKQKITSAAVIGSMAAAILMPASSFAAENDVKIKNNGRNSDNKVKIVNKNKTKVEQSNTLVVTNMIGTISNTGGNTVKDNSGKGDKSVETGDVTNTITVNVEGNTNTADVPCLCEEDDSTSDAVISDNGRNSDNKIKIKNKKSTKITQNSVSIVTNVIGTASNTGENSVKDNTGAGDKTVDTGDVDNTIDVTVEGSTNTL